MCNTYNGYIVLDGDKQLYNLGHRWYECDQLADPDQCGKYCVDDCVGGKCTECKEGYHLLADGSCKDCAKLATEGDCKEGCAWDPNWGDGVGGCWIAPETATEDDCSRGTWDKNKYKGWSGCVGCVVNQPSTGVWGPHYGPIPREEEDFPD